MQLCTQLLLIALSSCSAHMSSPTLQSAPGRGLSVARSQVLKSSPAARSLVASKALHATHGMTGSNASLKASTSGRLSNTPSRAGSARVAAGVGAARPAAAAAAASAAATRQPAAQQPQQQQQAQANPNVEVDMQRELIAKLQAQLAVRDSRIKELEEAGQPGEQQPAPEQQEDTTMPPEAEAGAAADTAQQPAAAGEQQDEERPAASLPSRASDADVVAEAPVSRTSSARGAAAAAAAATPTGLGSRSVSAGSSNGRPGSAVGSRRTSAGQQRVLSHAGSGASRTGGSSSNSRPGSRPLSGLSKQPAAAAVSAADGASDEPTPWRVTGDDEAAT